MIQEETKIYSKKKEEDKIIRDEKSSNKELNETAATLNKIESISFICKKENDLGENSGEIVQNLTIKSYCRFKPEKEIDKYFNIMKDEDSISLKNIYLKPKYIKSKIKIDFDKIYKFYKIFDRDSTNEDAYKAICKPLIYDLIFNKRSGLILSYGNSKGGKTYSIFGTSENPGILPRAINGIFKHINKKNKKSLQICCNFIELNNEEIYDLLNDEIGEEDNSYKKKIKVIENSNKFYLENVNYIQLDDYNKVNDTIQKVYKIINKERSLSSNLLFKIIILKDSDYSKIDLLSNEVISLSFVDLGTKVKSKVGFLRKENQSLHNLEKCLKILKYNRIAIKRKVVPFKDSVLTKLLSEYFLAKSNIKLICNINPVKDDINEAINAIKLCCLIQDSKLNKSKNSKNTINSKIMDNQEKSEIKNEKENNKDTNKSQKNILNNLENSNKEKEKDKSNRIIDEIDEIISKNTNTNTNNNFNFRNISQNIKHQIFKNDIIEKKSEDAKKTKNKSQIINSEINKIMKEQMDILIEEIKKLRAEVDFLKSENKDNGFYYKMDYLRNIPPIFPKNKNKPYLDNFQNPFINNSDIGNNSDKHKYYEDIENESYESNENVDFQKKDNKPLFAYSPFGPLYYNPYINNYNPFCPFPYGPFYPKSPYWPLGKQKIYDKNESTDKEDNNSNNMINNERNQIKNIREYPKKENNDGSYYGKDDYDGNESSTELKKEKVKKSPKKNNNNNRKIKKYIEKTKEYKRRVKAKKTKYN